MNKTHLIALYKSLNEGEALVLVTNYANYMMISESTLLNDDGFMNLSDYNNDLTIYNNNFTIKEVYKVTLSCGFNSAIRTYTHSTCIWSRDYTEVTLDQIAERFNIPVSQLKIKK